MTVLATLGLSFVLMVLVVGAMSVGVLAGRPPIRGSCGGLGAGRCASCSGVCRKQRATQDDAG